MKKYKFLMVMIMLLVLVVPFVSLAETEENTTVTTGVAENGKTPVKVYFFHGDGCPHCAEAEEWFQSIEGEYGNYFDVVAYEVWNNSENSDLMKEVAAYLNETVTGVPFIIVGDKNFKGFNAEMSSQILDEIKKEYELDLNSRTDVLASYFANKEDTDAKNHDQLVISLVTLCIILGIAIFVFYSRRGIESNSVIASEEKNEIEEIQDEVKEPIEKDEPIKEKGEKAKQDVKKVAKKGKGKSKGKNN